MPSVSEFVLERGGREHHGGDNGQNYPIAILAKGNALPHVCLESARDGYISCPSSHAAELPYIERQTGGNRIRNQIIGRIAVPRNDQITEVEVWR
jgi:hypothetical protein